MVGRNEQVRNLAMEELIGRKVRIKGHTMVDLVGFEGLVLDETRNTLVVGYGNKRVMVPKMGSVLEFPDAGCRSDVLHGEDILFRPEDRTKRCDRVRTKRN